MNGSVQQPSESDRRTQARLDVRIPIKVILPDREVPITAVNQDLSWGGARFLLGAQFVTGECLTPEVGIVRLSFPWKGGEQILADARVVRAQRMDPNRYMVAVRFQSLVPESQVRLEKLLTMLLLRDGEPNDAARKLFKELEIVVDDADRMRHLLEQVRAGSLTIAVAESYAPNQSIRLILSGTGGLPGLTLRARVASVERHDNAGEPHRLNLTFEHPAETIGNLVEILLTQLPPPSAPAPAPGGAAVADVPEWLRDVQIARVVVQRDQIANSDTSILSALEARHADELLYLLEGWGDPEDFEYRFQELTIGNRAVPGGWPMDAWEELGMLQDVHDEVHGLSASRQNPLRYGRLI